MRYKESLILKIPLLSITPQVIPSNRFVQSRVHSSVTVFGIFFILNSRTLKWNFLLILIVHLDDHINQSHLGIQP